MSCPVSKKRLRKAGRRIARDEASLSDYELLLWWRAAHIAPLERTMEIVHDALSVREGSILVGRLKRFDTIVDKLRRSPGSALDRLGDISGCRLIVGSIEDVYEARDALVGADSGIRERRDYIKQPRQSGYRGVHLEAACDIPDAPSGLLTEVQIRTEWEHLWATSVELYDLATGAGLKRGIASPEETHFFRLMSDLIYADHVGEGSVPLRDEIKKLDESLHVSSVLREASESIYVTGGSAEIVPSMTPGYCLLTLAEDVQTLEAHFYPEAQAHEATADYARLEEEAADGRLYLLARASSLEDLRMAYPNYFSNMEKLISWLMGQLA